MKRSLYLLLCLVMCAAMVFVSCGDDSEGQGNGDHTHTYSEEWSYDETNHWFAATCGCTDEKSNVAPHKDANGDKVCDDCEWDYDHTHTYAAGWTYDETDHWHEVTCGCSIAVSDKGAHKDENNDGKCDVCSMVEHAEHPYSTEWTHNETHHWHAVTCGHTVAPEKNNGYAAHVDANNDGICDGCSWDYDHEHTYATKYSHDAENHFFEVTCGHSIANKGVEKHKDANNDGLCDTCEWDYDHTHTFNEEEWKYDSQNHWHPATCGHDVKLAVTAHVDAENDIVCDVCGHDFHTNHTYSNEWTASEFKHWHEATCGCTDKKDEADHVDENNDGICDVCLYVICEHPEFTETFTHNKTHHWYAPACGHTIDPTQFADIAYGEHTDADNDGVCDTCAWDYDHTHTYATDVTFMDFGFHHCAATCGHSVSTAVEAHVDEDEDGFCDVCLEYASEEAFITYVTDYDKYMSVKSGKYAYQYSYFDTWDGVWISYDPTYAEYTYGNDYLITKTESYGEVTTKYYSLFMNADGMPTLFPIEVNHYGEITRGWETDLAYITGYEFNVASYQISGYGVEELIYNAYDLGAYAYNFGITKGSVYVDYINELVSFEEPTENLRNYDLVSGYVMSFVNVSYDGAYVYNVFISTDDNGAVTTLAINVKSYSEGNYTVNDEDMTCEIIPEAANADNYSYLITQSVGTRTTESNPYSPAEWLIDDLILEADTDFDGEGETPVGDVYELFMKCGYNNRLPIYFDSYIADKSAINNYTFESFLVTEDGEVPASEWSEFRASYENFGTPTIYLQGYKPGEYRVVASTEVATGEKALTFTVIVEYADSTGISAAVVVDEYGNTSEMDATEALVGLDLGISAVVPNGENPAFTVQVTSLNASLATVTPDEYNSNIWNFNASAAGEYVVTVTSVADASVNATLTITVNEPPTLEEIINGEYKYSDPWAGEYGLVFVPESEGATTGELTVTISKTEMDYSTWTEVHIELAEVFTYSYDEDGVITLTHKSGDETGIALEIRSYKLWIIDGWNEFELKAVVEEGLTGSGLLEDPYIITEGGSFVAVPDWNPIVYSFTPSLDGEITITFTGNDYLLIIGAYDDYYNSQEYTDAVNTIAFTAGEEFIFCVMMGGRTPVEVPFDVEITYYVESTTDWQNPVDVSYAATYATTIGAGEQAFFVVYHDGSENVYELGINTEDEATLFTGYITPAGPSLWETTMPFMQYLDTYTYAFIFAFENTTDEAIDMTFDISLVKAEV